MPVEQMRMPELLKDDLRYQVAFSYAGEDSAVARELADYLGGRGLKVFFAEFERPRLLGEDLHLEFERVFRTEAERAIVLISEAYVRKVWTRHEFAAVRAAIMERGQQNYLVPVRVDDTPLVGLLSTIGYADVRWQTPAEIGATIVTKFWPSLRFQKAYEVASPWSIVDHGRVTVDYRDFDGRHRIGSGLAMFETYWSRAGTDSVYCYANQTSSVTAIARLPRGVSFETITDASTLAARNTSEMARVGDSIILRNDHGFWAGLEIIEVVNPEDDEALTTVTFDYRILGDGSANFAKLG